MKRLWQRLVASRLGRILRDSSWMLVATAISAVLGIVQVVVVTRLLGPDLYGSLALIMAVTLTVKQIFAVRTWEWAIKEFAEAYTARDVGHAGDVIRRGYLAGLIVNACAFVVVVGGARFAAARFVHDRTAWLLVLGYGGVLLVNWTYDTSFAVLRVAGRFRFLAAQQVVMAVLRIVVTGGSVVIWRRLDTTVAAYVMVETLVSAWLLWSAHVVFREELGTAWWRTPRVRRTGRGMAKLIAIGSAIDTLKVAAGRVDVLVLGWYRPSVVVGNYQAAWNFLDVIQRVTQPIAMVAFSDLAKLGAKGQGRAILRVVGQLSLVVLVATLPVCVALYLAAPLICKVVYGAKYPDAAGLLQILSFSLLWLTGLWMNASFVSVGKPMWALECVAILTAIKVGCLALLTPAWGAPGVAWANLFYCLAVPLLIPMYLYRMRRWVNSPAFARQVPPASAPAP